MVDVDAREVEVDSPVRRRRWLSWALIGAAAAAGILVALQFRPHVYAGTVMQSPFEAPDLGLVDQHGRPFELTAHRGEVVLLYFGYTYCPDICPTTLATAARAIEKAGKDGEKVTVAMIGLDHERDTPEALGRYMSAFNPDFYGLTGSEEEIASAATEYGVFFQINEGTVESGYTVDHTATLFAIDPDGYLRVIYPVGIEPPALASDVEALLG